MQACRTSSCHLIALHYILCAYSLSFTFTSVQMAERFGLPVVTLVDTVGAWPTFECERDGQSEVPHILFLAIYIYSPSLSGSHSSHLLFSLLCQAIATNLTVMAGLKVPIITIMIGEGGTVQRSRCVCAYYANYTDENCRVSRILRDSMSVTMVSCQSSPIPLPLSD